MSGLSGKCGTTSFRPLKSSVFNPEGLSPGQLAKAVTKLIAAGVAVAGGVMINEAMAQILIFPFGSELAAFFVVR